MPKVNFSNLEEIAKRAVLWLADEAETVPFFVTKAVFHRGEIWEAAAFMKKYPKGSYPHTVLADRLRCGSNSAETILDCIHRASPDYLELDKRSDNELDTLLGDLQSTRFR